jgi:hypothetical protein
MASMTIECVAVMLELPVAFVQEWRHSLKLEMVGSLEATLEQEEEIDKALVRRWEFLPGSSKAMYLAPGCISITKEQVRTASVLQMPVSFVCEVQPKCRLELESVSTCTIYDDEVDEALIERWDSLTTQQRVVWWRCSPASSSAYAAQIKWDSTPAESTRGADAEEKTVEQAEEAAASNQAAFPFAYVYQTADPDSTDWGKYDGGRVGVKRSGYQNFCSKQFKSARENLARDRSLMVEEIETTEVWKELGRVWNELTENQREHWKAFAKAKAAMPVMDPFVQRPTRGVPHAGSESSVEPSSVSLSAAEYLSKHNIKSLLEEVINAAIVQQPPDPRMFIATYLCAGRIAAQASVRAAPAEMAAEEFLPLPESTAEGQVVPVDIQAAVDKGDVEEAKRLLTPIPDGMSEGLHKKLMKNAVIASKRAVVLARQAAERDMVACGEGNVECG